MRQKPSRPRLIQAMIDAFRLPDLRKRILITLGLLVAFRLIANIPLPGVNSTAMTQYFNNSALLGMLNLLSGGGMKNFSIAAMGVYPYITSTIILQLLTPIIPALQNMSQEGEAGRNRMNRISHWLTIPLAALSGYGQIALLKSQSISGTPIIGATTPLQLVMMIAILVAGTMFLVWLGELITDYGIGNGVSIIIFAGIITGYPNTIRQAILSSQSGANYIGLAVLAFIVLATIVLIVVFTEAHRRIPVQYARTQFKSGRMYRSSGGTHIPLRVNAAGMIPLIFSMSLVIFPGMIAQYFPNNDFAKHIVQLFNPSTALPLGFVYWGLYFVLTIFFGFFYTYVIFQEQDLPGTLQRQGGFIPGIRPGKATEQYLNNVVTKITLAGALFLAVVAVVPLIARGVGNMSAIQLSSMGLLIMVGVVLDTMKQMEAQLTMRRYEGFIK
ncbi:MAG TPA: preprotein translocase subunit SecY [Dehalococcoidales bacterium]|nr:preprotein translocase subunit SecY [Dehalococcoidales bacterium]